MRLSEWRRKCKWSHVFIHFFKPCKHLIQKEKKKERKRMMFRGSDACEASLRSFECLSPAGHLRLSEAPTGGRTHQTCLWWSGKTHESSARTCTLHQLSTELPVTEPPHAAGRRSELFWVQCFSSGAPGLVSSHQSPSTLTDLSWTWTRHLLVPSAVCTNWATATTTTHNRIKTQDASEWADSKVPDGISSPVVKQDTSSLLFRWCLLEGSWEFASKLCVLWSRPLGNLSAGAAGVEGAGAAAPSHVIRVQLIILSWRSNTPLVEAEQQTWASRLIKYAIFHGQNLWTQTKI